MKIRLAAEWLHSCSGCEMAILNTGAGLLELLTRLDIVHMPLLMDHKTGGHHGTAKEFFIPEAEIGLISGGVATEEHLTMLQAMRESCTTLIALGTCATHGGIPALANQWSPSAWTTTVFSTASTDSCSVPQQHLPVLSDRVYAVDEKIKVDLLIPGCPPHPDTLHRVLSALLDGNKPQLPGRSVCDTCPTVRKGKGAMETIRRNVCSSGPRITGPLRDMRCLLEQGLMCMGPVTVAGCAQDGAPPCITARMPCRGCFGPVRHRGNQLLDMMNALASNNIDYKSVIDRTSLLRFSGGHGRIRQQKK